MRRKRLEKTIRKKKTNQRIKRRKNKARLRIKKKRKGESASVDGNPSVRMVRKIFLKRKKKIQNKRIISPRLSSDPKLLIQKLVNRRLVTQKPMNRMNPLLKTANRAENPRKSVQNPINHRKMLRTL